MAWGSPRGGLPSPPSQPTSLLLSTLLSAGSVEGVSLCAGCLFLGRGASLLSDGWTGLWGTCRTRGWESVRWGVPGHQSGVSMAVLATCSVVNPEMYFGERRKTRSSS